MMIGMGMPRKKRSMERIIVSEVKMSVVNRGQRSRRRPPNVAAKLATNAPPSSETKIHKAP